MQGDRKGQGVHVIAIGLLTLINIAPALIYTAHGVSEITAAGRLSDDNRRAFQLIIVLIGYAEQPERRTDQESRFSVKVIDLDTLQLYLFVKERLSVEVFYSAGGLDKAVS